MTKEQVAIGVRVRALRNFSGVHAGTEGVIDELYALTNDSSGAMVAWDLPDQPLPKGYQRHDGRPAIKHGLLRDGFDLDTELQFLEVIETAYIDCWNRKFVFNDHVCIEMLMGVPDEKRTGRLVQVRKRAGAFGSDIFIIRLRDGGLASFENAMIRHANDKRFEDAFYRSNGKAPPIIPEQPTNDSDSTTETYSIAQKWPETGFIIEHPKQPDSPTQSFGMMIVQ